MQRRIINLIFLFLILIGSLYPLWFFLANREKRKIDSSYSFPLEKEYDELKKDDYYKDWNYFDAYLDKYNPFINFDKNNQVILNEELIKNEYDYYYIDSFSDLDQFDDFLIYNKKEYSITYYEDLTDKFIFFDCSNPITIYYQGKIINHSVILNNTLPSTKKVTLIYSRDLLIKESIIPQIELAKEVKNNNLYLINSMLNIKLSYNKFCYKIINCPYVGINKKEEKYIKYNHFILNSVI